MASQAPQPGDRVLNLAAPGGFFDKNLVLMYEGFYAGDKEYGILVKIPMSIYTLTVYGGSSGSPIMNISGDLISMVHSAYRGMGTVTRGPTWKVLKLFFEKHIK